VGRGGGFGRVDVALDTTCWTVLGAEVTVLCTVETTDGGGLPPPLPPPLTVPAAVLAGALTELELGPEDAEADGAVGLALGFEADGGAL
jgi:hypothetical protein